MVSPQNAGFGPFKGGALMALVAVMFRLAVAGVLAAALVQAPDPDRDREQWQRVPEIFAAMQVKAGVTVADIGAGSGYFTWRLARAVTPRGRVYAVDISEREVKRLREHADAEGVTNVTIVEGTTDDPKLPAGSIDAILLVKTYHELSAYPEMLARMRDALKPAGRLVIVDQIGTSRRDAARDEQARSHEIAAAYVEKDLREAGFEIVAVRDPFIEKDDDGDQQWMIVAAKP
jgi:predicted methyltransferase